MNDHTCCHCALMCDVRTRLYEFACCQCGDVLPITILVYPVPVDRIIAEYKQRRTQWVGHSQ